MPPIGYLVGGVDFKDLKVPLPEVTIKVPNPEKVGELMDKVLPAVDIKYGMFLQTTFDFLIVAACVFLVVKGMNAVHKKAEAAPPPPVPPQETLLTEIRDILKKMAD
jgi:large conductance mechanosensitive channel